MQDHPHYKQEDTAYTEVENGISGNFHSGISALMVENTLIPKCKNRVKKNQFKDYAHDVSIPDL
jgi:hypothetical protein